MPLCTCVCLCVCVYVCVLIFGVLCREMGAAFILENELEISGSFGYPQYSPLTDFPEVSNLIMEFLI